VRRAAPGRDDRAGVVRFSFGSYITATTLTTKHSTRCCSWRSPGERLTQRRPTIGIALALVVAARHRHADQGRAHAAVMMTLAYVGWAWRNGDVARSSHSLKLRIACLRSCCWDRSRSACRGALCFAGVEAVQPTDPICRCTTARNRLGLSPPNVHGFTSRLCAEGTSDIHAACATGGQPAGDGGSSARVVSVSFATCPNQCRLVLTSSQGPLSFALAIIRRVTADSAKRRWPIRGSIRFDGDLWLAAALAVINHGIRDGLEVHHVGFRGWLRLVERSSYLRRRHNAGFADSIGRSAEKACAAGI